MINSNEAPAGRCIGSQNPLVYRSEHRSATIRPRHFFAINLRVLQHFLLGSGAEHYEVWGETLLPGKSADMATRQQQQPQQQQQQQSISYIVSTMSGLFLTVATLFLILTLANGQHSCGFKLRLECKLGNGLPCNQRPPSTKCVELSYLKYIFENTGSSKVTVTSAVRTINGASPVQLASKVSPNPIPVGQKGSFQEPLSVNYCTGALQGIKVKGEGKC